MSVCAYALFIHFGVCSVYERERGEREGEREREREREGERERGRELSRLGHISYLHFFLNFVKLS